MDPVQASLQLTIAAGGRVVVLNRRLSPFEVEGLVVVQSEDAALARISEHPTDVVICDWPASKQFVEVLAAEQRISVMMTVSAEADRREAVGFVREVRGCALLPAGYSLHALLGLDGAELDDGLSVRFLRRLPRLSALWGRKKTGVVQFLRPDGAWEWIAVKDGGLAQAGDVSVMRGALQSGRIRFIERHVSGDGSRPAMGRLLLELAGTRTDSRFATTHQHWILHSPRPGDFPISGVLRSVLQAADGERPLWQLLHTLQIPSGRIGEELHALVRLQLARLRPPSGHNLHELHDHIDRLSTQRSRLADGSDEEVYGLPDDAPPALKRKVARWQQERYARISERDDLSTDDAEDAVALSEAWMDRFTRDS